MASIQPILSNTSLYDQDFYAWTQDQAARLRKAAAERLNADVDWENLAEEVDSMGRSDRREIRSRLEIVLLHLGKLAFISDLPPRMGWMETVNEQRRCTELVIEDSPSLQTYPRDVLEKAWERALRPLNDAVPPAVRVTLPQVCPWDLEREILAEGWFPQPPAAPDSSV